MFWLGLARLIKCCRMKKRLFSTFHFGDMLSNLPFTSLAMDRYPQNHNLPKKNNINSIVCY